MACVCPSGMTEVSVSDVIQAYCKQGGCQSGSTTYLQQRWVTKNLTCKEKSGTVKTVPCEVLSGCC